MITIKEKKRSDEKMAICIGVTSDLTFAAAITFLNFAELHGTKDYVFYLFTDRVDKKSVNILRKAGLEVVPVKYSPNLHWTEIWSSRSIAYFSPLVLSKLEAFRLVEIHPVVLWLDYDIVITRRLESLLFDSGFGVAFARGSQEIKTAFTNPEKIEELQNVSGFGMSAHIVSFRSSLSPSHSLIRDSNYYLRKYHKYLYLPEQGIFDLVFHKHQVEIKALDMNQFGYVPRGNDYPETAAILHSVGPRKFWNGLDNEKWKELEQKWKVMGGRGFSRARSRLALTVRKVKHVLAIFMVKMSNLSKPEKS